MRQNAYDDSADADAARAPTLNGGWEAAAPVVNPHGQGADTGFTSALRLQRLAGNRAVTTLVQARSRGQRPAGVNLQRDGVTSAPVEVTGLATAVSAEPLARINEAEQSALTQLAAAATDRRTDVEASFGAASQQVGQSFRTFEGQSRADERTDSAQIHVAGAAAK